MKGNYDENGFFVRHMYFNGEVDRVHMAILGLLHTMYEIKKSWVVIFPLEMMYQIAKQELHLPQILGTNQVMFEATIKQYSSTGDYKMVYNEDEALVGVTVNFLQFTEHTSSCQHQVYQIGSIPSEGYDKPPIQQ